MNLTPGEKIPALIHRYNRRKEQIQESLVNLSVYSSQSYHDIKFMTATERQLLSKQVKEKMAAQSGNKKEML